MHLIMIIFALGCAFLLRFAQVESSGNWRQRWQQSLFLFLLAPLILLTTALAVLCMGTSGEMLGLRASWFSYILAVAFLGSAVFSLLKLGYQAWQSIQKIATYPQKYIAGKQVRWLDLAVPYSAQIGLWRPELVVSKGLLDTLDTEQLEAVFAHEQAHFDCRDTFCFFWLGWLSSFTAWLPNSEKLWQDLLFCREIRADRIATKQVDALVLAESLLAVAKAPMKSPASFCTPFYTNRLPLRIEALLADSEPAIITTNWWFWSGLVLVMLPWATIPFHY